MTRGVLVEDYAVDANIAHYTFHLRGVEVDDSGNTYNGPVKSYGIDGRAMMDLFGQGLPGVTPEEDAAVMAQRFALSKKDELLALLDSSRGMATVPNLKGTILT